MFISLYIRAFVVVRQRDRLFPSTLAALSRTIILPLPTIVFFSEVVVPRSVYPTVIGASVGTATQIRVGILAVECIFSILPIVATSTTSIASPSPVVLQIAVVVLAIILHELVAVQATVTIPMIHWQWCKPQRPIHKDSIVLRRL